MEVGNEKSEVGSQSALISDFPLLTSNLTIHCDRRMCGGSRSRC